MRIESLTILLAAAVLVNLAVTATLLVTMRAGRRSWLVGRGGEPAAAITAAPAEPAREATADPAAPPGVSLATYDRVVRVVSYALLLVSAAIVAMSGLWSNALGVIFALVAGTAVLLLVVHDLLPARWLGRARYVLEGVAAIAFVTVLVGLTGGVESPFFFGYYLVVAGAALVASHRATLAIAIASAAAYLAAVAVASGFVAPTAAQTTSAAVNLVALALLSYLTVVVARDQRRARDRAVLLSVEDTLTGLYNRAHCFTAIEREIQRAQRTGRDFCLLMIDLDGLKPINDTYGHHVGDSVLRGMAGVILASIRRLDMAARYGGDEFVVLLPETEPTGAFVVAEKIRAGVAAVSWPMEGTAITITTSIGIVSYPADGSTADALLRSADAAMYVSKRLGKDRIAAFADTGPTVTIAGGRAVTIRPGAIVPPSARERIGVAVAPLAQAAPERVAVPIVAAGEAEAGAIEGAEPRAAARTAGPAVAPAGEAAAAPLAFALPGDALTDLLTGLDSRLTWDRTIRDEAARASRYSRPVTAVCAELDGHAPLAERFPSAADRLVRAVGDALRNHARSADRVARVGPARFRVLLPETDEIQAIHYVERVRDACDRWLEGGAVPLHLSLGWASPAPDGDLETAQRAAEDRMYDDRARASRTAVRGRAEADAASTQVRAEESA